MIDMRMDFTSIEDEAKGGVLILLATMLFGVTTLYFDAIKTPPAPDTSTEAPVVIKFLAVPEPQAIRPSILMDWPLAARMIEIEEEKRPAAADVQTEPQEIDTKEDKTRHHRHRRRHHRRRY